MKTREELAEEWADKCVGASWRSKAGWITCRDNFLAGLTAGEERYKTKVVAKLQKHKDEILQLIKENSASPLELLRVLTIKLQDVSGSENEMEK